MRQKHDYDAMVRRCIAYVYEITAETTRKEAFQRLEALVAPFALFFVALLLVRFLYADALKYVPPPKSTDSTSMASSFRALLLEMQPDPAERELYNFITFPIDSGYRRREERVGQEYHRDSRWHYYFFNLWISHTYKVKVVNAPDLAVALMRTSPACVQRRRVTMERFTSQLSTIHGRPYSLTDETWLVIRSTKSQRRLWDACPSHMDEATTFEKIRTPIDPGCILLILLEDAVSIDTVFRMILTQVTLHLVLYMTDLLRS